MTEQEWLECTDPMVMLEFLQGTANGRKFRLFGCACCRCNWDSIAKRSREAVEATERYVDGLNTEDDLGLVVRAGWESDQSESDCLVIEATRLYLIRSGSDQCTISWE